MAGPVAETLFWLLAVATLVAHAFILRSTVRGMDAARVGARAPWGELVWALLPALALVALFVWTWHAMHPDTLRVMLPAERLPPGGITS